VSGHARWSFGVSRKFRAGRYEAWAQVFDTKKRSSSWYARGASRTFRLR